VGQPSSVAFGVTWEESSDLQKREPMSKVTDWPRGCDLHVVGLAADRPPQDL
jgi:hypothetical protein